MHFKTETLVGIFVLAATAIFLYMSFQLGSLRFDNSAYVCYTLFCKDVAGLTPKADVKISGVKAGWVESIELCPDTSVKVGLRILKQCTLYEGMQVLIRQEGLLGAKYLELIPASIPGAALQPGSVLPLSIRQFVSIDDLFYSFQKITQHMESLGTASSDIAARTQDLIKELKQSLNRVNILIDQFSDSADSCSKGVNQTLDAFKDVALHVHQALDKAQEPVAQIGDLVQKVKEGQGSLGKLLHDTQVYEDVKSTAQFARNCLRCARGCALGLDTHFEVLPQRCRGTNVKGYFDVWLYPCSDLFCLVGPVYSHHGFAKKKYERVDGRCKTIKEEKSDSFTLNLQVGARLPFNWQVRAGLFQGTAGFGFDWCLPLDCVRWISSFEAFDFKGHTRFDSDCRPYLKWINRLYFTNGFYLTFGANDFISKRSTTGFIGLGATFSTCDIWPCRK